MNTGTFLLLTTLCVITGNFIAQAGGYILLHFKNRRDMPLYSMMPDDMPGYTFPTDKLEVVNPMIITPQLQIEYEAWVQKEDIDSFDVIRASDWATFLEQRKQTS